MMPGENTFLQFVTIGLPQVNTPETDKTEKKEEVHLIPTEVGVEQIAKPIPDTETADMNECTDNQPDLEAADSTEFAPPQWMDSADLSANDYPTQILTADSTEPKNEPAQQNVAHKPQKKVGKLEVADENNLPDTFGSGVPDKETLHKRQYYTMRETADMLGVNQSLLRYWENEFSELRPRKNRKGDRYFRPQDIETLQLIFHLLKVRKFTIEGAKDYLKQNKNALETFELIQKLEKLKIFLTEIRSNL
jgi:DNA-binding transcriptional MerR regulator